MVEETARDASPLYRCPFCPPKGLTSPIIGLMMKTKEYSEKALLVHLRKYHPDCNIDLLPFEVRDRVRKLQPRWREHRNDA